jgi:putative ABC transport system permease protein
MTRVLLRLSLALYPRSFRREFADEMAKVLTDRWALTRAKRGNWALVGLMARDVPDLLRHAVIEHTNQRATSVRTRHGGKRSARGSGHMFEQLARDIWYAVRSLARARGFTATVVGTLALGIGANTAIFSVVHAVLLTPPPYESPAELAMVWEQFLPRNRTQNVLSPRNFRAWQEQNEVFSGIAAMFERGRNLTGEGDPQVVSVGFVSTNLFEILGVRPLLGRVLRPEEMDPTNSRVVVLEFGFWQRQFGGDPGVLGRTITLQDASYQIVGVMPEGFDFPSEPDMWSPAALSASEWESTGRFLIAVARLRPGTTVLQAQAAMDRLGVRLRERWPTANDGWGINLVPLQEQVAGPIRPALLVLLGAVGVVLLIACANVANLLLGRAAVRGKEIAIRSALGAGRRRLVRQLLTESAVLTAAALGVGLVVAFGAVSVLVTFGPSDIPRLDDIALNGRVLGFTLAVAGFTGMGFGLMPALHLSKPDVQSTLKVGGKTSAGHGSHRLRGLLVVSEISLALVLLVGAGLLIRSFQRMLDVELGFEPAQVLSLEVQLPGSRYPNPTQRVVFFNEVIDRIEGLPQVQAASAINFLPLDGMGAATSFIVDELPVPGPADWPVADVRAVHHDYFATMGIMALQGRVFDGAERADAQLFPIVISKSMADRFWPNANPLGKTITMPWNGLMHGEVIGVVADVRHTGLETAPRSKIYWSHQQFLYNFMSFVVRTNVDPMSVLPAVQEQLWALDPQLPVSDVRTMDERLGSTYHQRRFNMWLLGGFAAVALILACVGIYGVMSYAVAQRTHELGLRIALGATPGEVLRIVVGKGLALTLAAVAVGLVAAFGVTRTMSSLLFQVDALDPLTFVSVAVLLSGVAVAACWMPARKATRVDPMIALRTE